MPKAYYARLFADIEESGIGYDRYFSALNQLSPTTGMADLVTSKSLYAKKLLRRTGMAQKALADRFGVSKQYVGQVMRGGRKLPALWEKYLKSKATCTDV